MKNKKRVKKASLNLGLISLLVIGTLFIFSAQLYTLRVEVDEKGYHVIWEGTLAEAAEADPGSGASGFLSVYFHPHQATPHASYMENSSSNLESNCTTNGLGFANADDQEVDLAHSTTFDVVFLVRGNATHCKVGGTFYDTNLKIQWTCADLSVGADTELTHLAGEGNAVSNNTDYEFLRMTFWDDNSGSGFTISQDQTVEITSIKLLAYY